MQAPERLNVMFSRARHQLILIGDFEQFRAGADAMDEWLSHISDGVRKRSFWTELLDSFEDFDGDSHIRGDGTERAIRLPAGYIEGVEV